MTNSVGPVDLFHLAGRTPQQPLHGRLSDLEAAFVLAHDFAFATVSKP